MGDIHHAQPSNSLLGLSFWRKEMIKFEIGEEVIVSQNAYCHDYEQVKGFVSMNVKGKKCIVLDHRTEEDNGEFFGLNVLVEYYGISQWVAEECLS